LSEAGLPSSFWSSALNHSALLYNLTPHIRLKWCSPWEMLHGKESAIAKRPKLANFGSACTVYPKRKDPLRKKDKFHSQSLRGIYLGPGDLSSTIKVYLPSFNRIRRFHDYVMYEGDFDHGMREENESNPDVNDSSLDFQEDSNPAEEEMKNIQPTEIQRDPSEPLLNRRYSPRLQMKALEQVNLFLLTGDVSEEDGIPTSIHEAMSLQEWRSSAEDEFNSLYSLVTFEEIPKSEITTSPVPVKWVFKV
jgi:hypothetical protein